MRDRDKVKELIRKLLRLAESERGLGHEIAADNIAAQAQEILIRYKLDITELEAESQDRDDPFGKTWWHPLERGFVQTNADFAWQQFLASVVADAHFCAVLGHSETNIFQFIGRDLDREVCIWMFEFLLREMMQQCEIEWRIYSQGIWWWSSDQSTTTFRQDFETSFYFGSAQMINQRYIEQRRAMQVADDLLCQHQLMPIGKLEKAARQVKDYAASQASEVKTINAPDGEVNRWGFAAGLRHGSQVLLQPHALTEKKDETQD